MGFSRGRSIEVHCEAVLADRRRLDEEYRWFYASVPGRLSAAYWKRMRPSVRRLEQLTTFEELRSRVLELDRDASTQQEIADCLNAEGHRPPRPARFSVSFAANLPDKCRPRGKRSSVLEAIVAVEAVEPGRRQRVACRQGGSEQPSSSVSRGDGSAPVIPHRTLLVSCRS